MSERTSLQMTSDRIQYLDSLRGIAIAIVVLYHAYARWPEVMPFGSKFADFPLFSNGWLGVQLFFMISGFVIFLTLEKCDSLGEFLFRRWLRLFPAMLICSLLIWVSLPLLPERPAGQAHAAQLIPGLTFIEPGWFELVGFQVQPIEGAFWSLFVEAQFYVVVGLCYFLGDGRRSALIGLTGLFLLSFAISPLRQYFVTFNDSTISQALGFLSEHLHLRYYDWFVTGALFYVYCLDRSKGALALAAIAAVISVLTQVRSDGWQVMIPAAIVAAAFALPILSTTAASILNQQVLIFLGYISYPLYLMHENMMVALTVKFGRWLPNLWPILMPVIPAGIVMLLAYVVSACAEGPLKAALRDGAHSLRNILRSRNV